jgi:predicted DNA-binding transcriptional regulator YafY
MEAAMTETPFERPDGFDLLPFWQEWCAQIERFREKVTVTVQVLPGGVETLMAQFGDYVAALIIETPPNDDGSTTITLTFGSLEEACRQLLGVATAVRIITPPELIDRLRATATAVLVHYSQPRQP